MPYWQLFDCVQPVTYMYDHHRCRSSHEGLLNIAAEDQATGYHMLQAGKPANIAMHEAQPLQSPNNFQNITILCGPETVVIRTVTGH